MKFKLLIPLLLFINLNCLALNKRTFNADTTRQHRSKQTIRLHYPPTPRSPEEFDRLFKPWYSNCAFTNKYSITKLLHRYPFSRAGKILAISFHLAQYPNSGKNDSLTTNTLASKETLLKGGFSIKADTLDRSTLIEYKILTSDQIRRLTTILYNVNFKKPGYNLVGGAKCYEPRNALVFVDKHGKVYDYLEVCFACKHYASKSDRLNVGIECTQKYEILRKYFKSIGINFGTRKNENRE